MPAAATAPVPQNWDSVKFTDEEISRFWSKTKKLDGDGCWEWTGSVFKRVSSEKSHYGQFKITRSGGVIKNMRANRASYILHYGEIPDGMTVCHHCDNPCCVRPDHLFLGTHKDNSHDRIRKGRGLLKGYKHKPEHIRRGSATGMARLTEDAVLRIREIYSTGTKTKVSLAKEFGVSDQTIGFIICGRTWTHVGGHTKKTNKSENSRRGVFLSRNEVPPPPQKGVMPVNLKDSAVSETAHPAQSQ